MVENASVNMMYADLDMKIHYMNPRAKQTLKKLEAYLPMRVDQMIGQSIDMFHKTSRASAADPGRSRAICLVKRPFKLAPSCSSCRSARWLIRRPVYRPDAHLGGDDRASRGQGPRGRDAGQHHGGQPVARGPGTCANTPRCDHLGPWERFARLSAGRTDRSGKINADEQVLRFVTATSGSVSEEFRRVTAEARFREGEGLNGQAWQIARPGLRARSGRDARPAPGRRSPSATG